VNEADGHNPAADVSSGAFSGESDLCRRIPALYQSLSDADVDELYPFGPCTCRSSLAPEKYGDVLYTANATIMRASDAEGFAILAEAKQAKVAIVHAAAPTGNEINDPVLLHRAILSIFVAPVLSNGGTTTLILQPWNCRTHQNTKTMAALFAKAISTEIDGICLGRLYHEIHFAFPPEGSSAREYSAETDSKKLTAQEIFKKEFVNPNHSVRLEEK